jgi:hypothetical protein
MQRFRIETRGTRGKSRLPPKNRDDSSTLDDVSGLLGRRAPGVAAPGVALPADLRGDDPAPATRLPPPGRRGGPGRGILVLGVGPLAVAGRLLPHPPAAGRTARPRGAHQVRPQQQQRRRVRRGREPRRGERGRGLLRRAQRPQDQHRRRLLQAQPHRQDTRSRQGGQNFR